MTEKITQAAEPRRRGRPVKADALGGKLQVRVSDHTADVCRKLGGSAFLRGILDRIAGEYDRLDADRREAQSGREELFRRIAEEAVRIPFAEASVSCGFPDAAFDSRVEPFSLHSYLVYNAHDAYAVEARGDSMADAGIFEGDMLVLDRSMRPRNGDIVLALLHGDMTLKRLRYDRAGRPELHPENASAEYPVIRPAEHDDFSVQGVLTGLLRRYA